MKIIVTSDIHRNKNVIKYILENFVGDEYRYYDCGDSELSPNDLLSFLTVKGNCDFRNYPRYRIIEIDDYLKILITHGHLYKNEQLLQMCKDNNCNVVITGHTHIKKLQIVDDIYMINPGSITRPRDVDSNTFLIIDYDVINHNINFEFVKINL